MDVKGFVERCQSCGGAIWFTASEPSLSEHRARTEHVVIGESLTIQTLDQIPDRGHRAECARKDRAR